VRGSDNPGPHDPADYCGDPVEIFGMTIPPPEHCETACVSPDAHVFDDKQCTTSKGVGHAVTEYDGVFGVCSYEQGGTLLTFDECLDAPAPNVEVCEPLVMIATAAGHTHVLSPTMTAADVTAGAARTYTLTGGGHQHTVTITADDMAKLEANFGAGETSTDTNGHTHLVSVRCQ